MKLFTLFLMVFFYQAAFAAPKVAVVKLVRGDADVLTLGKTTPLKVDDWVESGAVVKTHEKSFVKLIFVDKSQMNVGPNSEMKIESFSGKDSGVIDLVKGKIRSQVSKDYLQINKDKSKLFIKTQNAVMGVRGTDFMISTNGTNTSTVLFEGEVVFNKLEQRGEVSSSKLESIVDRGVRMFPGEFSVMEANRPMPTVPSLLNVQQREKLEKNQDFSADKGPSSTDNESAKSVVPAGLNGQQVSNSGEVLKSEVAQVVTVDSQTKSPTSSDPDGFVKGDLVKPANGSFVHIDSGVIIPPGPGSVLDANTNTYIPGQEAGKVGADGNYIPPKNIEITSDGKILVKTLDPTGRQLASGTLSPTTIAPEDKPLDGAVLTDVSLPGTNTVDTRFAPTGGFTGSNDPTRAISTSSDVIIRAKPNQ
ncbi:MAG: FecR family protein [Bacteriovoracaceae bacterium]|nr:FecR family protein [Bacteriovoracaceae bacterium]